MNDMNLMSPSVIMKGRHDFRRAAAKALVSISLPRVVEEQPEVPIPTAAACSAIFLSGGPLRPPMPYQNRRRCAGDNL